MRLSGLTSPGAAVPTCVTSTVTAKSGASSRRSNLPLQVRHAGCLRADRRAGNHIVTCHSAVVFHVPQDLFQRQGKFCRKKVSGNDFKQAVLEDGRQFRRGLIALNTFFLALPLPLMPYKVMPSFNSCWNKRNISCGLSGSVAY